MTLGLEFIGQNKEEFRTNLVGTHYNYFAEVILMSIDQKIKKKKKKKKKKSPKLSPLYMYLE